MITGPSLSWATAPRPCSIEIDSTRASRRGGAAAATNTRSRAGPSGRCPLPGRAPSRTIGSEPETFAPSRSVPSGATATSRPPATSIATGRFCTIVIFKPCGKSVSTASDLTIGSSATARRRAGGRGGGRGGGGGGGGRGGGWSGGGGGAGAGGEGGGRGRGGGRNRSGAPPDGGTSHAAGGWTPRHARRGASGRAPVGTPRIG